MGIATVNNDILHKATFMSSVCCAAGDEHLSTSRVENPVLPCHGGNAWMREILALDIISLKSTGTRSRPRSSSDALQVLRQLSSQYAALSSHQQRDGQVPVQVRPEGACAPCFGSPADPEGCILPGCDKCEAASNTPGCLPAGA